MHILMLHIGNMRNSFICIYPEDQNLFNALQSTICYSQYLMQKPVRTEISKSASLSTTYTQIMQIGELISYSYSYSY